MLQDFLLGVFVLLSLINVVHFGLYLIGADYYDILKFRSKTKYKRNHNAIKPLVSVLIPAHNEEKSIIRSLESVRHSSYKKIEIIVIDDASTDATRLLVRKYIKQYPKMNLKLMFKRNNVGKAGALNHALRNGARGDLVMTLDADSLIHKNTIANAVRYFDDPKIVGVAANVCIIDGDTILGLMQKFEYLVGYRSKKFFSVTNCEFIVGGVASTYRADIIKQVGFYDQDVITEDIALSLKIVGQGNKKNRVVYGVDVIAMTEGVQTFKALLDQRLRWKMGNLQSILKYRQLFKRNGLYSAMLRWYRIPMAFLGEILLVLEPFALGYIIYYCFMVGNLYLIIGAYALIAVYLSWNILPDENMNWTKKMQMIAYVPAMYFVMYIMNVVQLVSITRCLLNYRQVLRQVEARSVWVSPERKGQTSNIATALAEKEYSDAMV